MTNSELSINDRFFISNSGTEYSIDLSGKMRFWNIPIKKVLLRSPDRRPRYMKIIIPDRAYQKSFFLSERSVTGIESFVATDSSNPIFLKGLERS